MSTPADTLAESVRTVVRLLADARATSVGDLRRRQQVAHVELFTALQKYERATARAPQEGRAGS